MREIIVKGKALPIHFGMRVIHEYCKANQVEMDKALQQENPLAALETLVAIATIGLNDGARRSGLEKRYSEDEVWDMLDERIGLVVEIGEILAEAIHPHVEQLGSVGNVPKSFPTASEQTKRKKRRRPNR